MFRSVVKLVSALQSNVSPSEIASGAVLSLYFGFLPLNGTQLIFLILAFFFFKVNRAATMFCLPFLKLIYILGLSRLADSVGFFFLTQIDFLKPLWAWINSAPILTYMNLNQTLVMGGFIIAAGLSFPFYLLMVRAVYGYRKRVAPNIEKWWLVKWLKGLSIVKWVASWWPTGH